MPHRRDHCAFNAWILCNYTNYTVDFIILKALKRQGLGLELLHCVFYARIVNKIMYAIPAWYGFLNKSIANN